jgi:hypothetical protein
MVTLVRFTLESLSSAPPPPAIFPLNVTRFSAHVSPFVKRPPPPQPPVQVLSLTVASMSDRLSKLAMPPPWIAAVFCLTTTLVRLRVATSVPRPPFAMPPPATPSGLPLRMVMPDIDVVPLANTSNTRSIPLPSMIVLATPAPVMMTGSLMSRSPVAARSSPRPLMVSKYGLALAGMTMVSTPLLAFEAWMAARSVQTTGAAVAQFVATAPFTRSCVLLTLNTFAAAWTGARPASTHRTARSGAQRSHRRRVWLPGVTAGAPSSLGKPPRSLPSREADT